MTLPMLDLDQFESLDDALVKIEPGDRYIDVARPLIALGLELPMSLTTFFWLSTLTRSQGLHAGIAREASENNPQAVFPLLRTFQECVVTLMYVCEHPEYVAAISTPARDQPKHGPRRKSMQALMSAVSHRATNLGPVWAQLSDTSHYGSKAFWAPHTIADEEEHRLEWTSSPQWRDDKEGLIACALTLELAQATTNHLSEYAERHILAAAGTAK